MQLDHKYLINDTIHFQILGDILDYTTIALALY